MVWVDDNSDGVSASSRVHIDVASTSCCTSGDSGTTIGVRRILRAHGELIVTGTEVSGDYKTANPGCIVQR